MYLYKNVQEVFWPYDDDGRLVGEDVFEPDPSGAEITKLDPSDILTTAKAKELLAPLIKPLLGMTTRPGRHRCVSSR
jgi:hypothetical protein